MMDWDPQRYVWEQVAEIIENRIKNGTYGPHTQLSEHRLAEELGVARMTVRRALKDLRERGVIVTLVGRGSFPARRGEGT